MTDPTKAMFLDVDGCLNTPENAGAWTRLGRDESLTPELVDRARRIQEATGATVVLSSTWRLEQCAGLAKTILCLERRGWPRARDVFSREVTPHLGGPRGAEIALYLEEHPEIKRFAIVDDDSDLEGLTMYWVPVDWRRGLQEEHVQLAIEKLGPLQTG